MNRNDSRVLFTDLGIRKSTHKSTCTYVVVSHYLLKILLPLVHSFLRWWKVLMTRGTSLQCTNDPPCSRLRLVKESFPVPYLFHQSLWCRLTFCLSVGNRYSWQWWTDKRFPSFIRKLPAVYRWSETIQSDWLHHAILARILARVFWNIFLFVFLYKVPFGKFPWPNPSLEYFQSYSQTGGGAPGGEAHLSYSS